MKVACGVPARWTMALWAASLVPACSSARPAGDGPLLGSELAGAGAALGGALASVDSAGGEGEAGGLGGARGLAGEPPSGADGLTLSLHNVVETRPVLAHDPISGPLERVELPPLFTLRANPPAGTLSVEFSVGEYSRLDEKPPFLMHEDGTGRARWQPGLGEHVVSVTAFAEPGAQGEPTARRVQTISYAATGLDPNFESLSEAENTGWAEANVHAVMQAREFVGSLGDKLPYRLFVPEHYDAAVKYPLLVFLHDRAARGTDNRPGIYDSRLFHGARSLVSPNFRHEFPAIILVPQCPDEPSYHEWARWYGASEAEPQAGLVYADGYYPSHDEPSTAARLVRELVDDTRGEFSIDAGRIYLAGEGMGGHGTWDLSWRWPEVWAAGVPVAGWTDPSRAHLVLKLPFWSFHSSLDSVNNVVGSLLMVDKLKVLCGSVRYTQYADVTHEQTFDRVWGTEALLLSWIFSQERQPGLK